MIIWDEKPPAKLQGVIDSIDDQFPYTESHVTCPPERVIGLGIVIVTTRTRLVNDGAILAARQAAR